MRLHWRLAKNALANLGRGGAAALTAVLLPPILVRHMPSAAYGAWVLVLQTAGYVAYLDLGLQTAVGRYVAYAREKNDLGQRDAVFSTALAGLAGAGLLALALLALAAWAAPVIFPRMPSALLPQLRWALAIVGSSLAFGLPACAWSGVFVGLERYEIPALTTAGGRTLAAAGLVAAALTGQSLVVMALIVAAGNLLSYAALYAFLRRLAPGLRFHRQRVSRDTARMLSSYCFNLTVMVLSTLVVTGFDLILVARFDFAALSAYSVAASPIVLLAGLLYAVLSVIMPHAATLDARADSKGLGDLTLAATRISVLLLLMTGVPLLIYAGPILRLWVGSQFVQSGRPILIVLVVANLVRLLGAAYATVAIAAGQQCCLTISPIAEAISNLAASILLGSRYGAIGVALGTLCGSVAGLATHLLYSMPRTRRTLDFKRSRWLLSGVLAPALATAPLLLLAGRSGLGSPVAPVWFIGAGLLSLAAAGWVAQRSGFALLERGA